MPRKAHKSRIIVPHIEGCSGGWSGILDDKKPFFFGNFAANEHTQHRHYVWYRVLCNNTRCPAIKAVESQILIDAP